MKFITLAIGVLAVAATGFAQDPKIKVGNEVVTFDAMPIKVNGITMVPIRSMVSAMEGTMRWSPDTRTISVWNKSKRFDLVLNSRDAMVNDKPMKMDEAPLIRKNRIYVPIKFVADASGYMISQESGWLVLRPILK
ncbi:MAG: copper amine oxidase N-terminal domain-containing protein [Chlorobia bacterium]|nr:copper amine oxidase N-terminal domain-containing protein [Fimbriimonadaceae bacterium]